MLHLYSLDHDQYETVFVNGFLLIKFLDTLKFVSHVAQSLQFVETKFVFIPNLVFNPFYVYI